MKKAIVSGANGFIGRAVVNELINNHVSVIALCRKSSQHIFPPNVRVLEFDLEHIDKLLDDISDRDIDVFYHFAWEGTSGVSRADVELQLKNALWTVECLKVAKQLNCKRFVGSGSIMEQETIAASYTQNNQPGLGYIYGSGKLVAHTMSMSVAADIGIELVWGMITNAYGPGEISQRMLNTTIRKIIADEPLQFTAATQNYDFIFIDDVARAFYLLGEKGKAFCHYIIGSSDAEKFLLEMKDTIAPDKQFLFGSIPYTGVNMSLEQFRSSEIEKDTGFRASVSFREGVQKTMNWIKEYDKQ